MQDENVKPLTEEEKEKRKILSNRRLFAALVILNVVLLGYLIFQIVYVFTSK